MTTVEKGLSFIVLVLMIVLASLHGALAVVDAHSVTMGSNSVFRDVLHGMSVTTNSTIRIDNITAGSGTNAPNVSIFHDEGGGTASLVTSTSNRTGDVWYLFQILSAGTYFVVVTNQSYSFTADYGSGSFPITGTNLQWNGRAYPVSYETQTTGWTVDAFASSIVSIGSTDNPPTSNLTVTLLSPEDDATVTNNTFDFAYEVFDGYGVNATCVLELNGTPGTPESVSMNATHYFNASGIVPGENNWTVDCSDGVTDDMPPEYSLIYVPCSPSWVCARYADCSGGTLICLNATDLATCGVEFNETLSAYDLSCEDANRTTIFYDTFTGADNWTYFGITHNFTDGILEMQDSPSASQGAYVTVVVGNETIHVETLLRYSQNSGDYMGIISSNFYPHTNNFEIFLQHSREIVCQNGVSIYESGVIIDLNKWYLFDVIYNPVSEFWNLSINGSLVCSDMANMTNVAFQEFIIGGGSSPASWMGESDYVNISQDAFFCTPSWSCSAFDACNISNVTPCLNVTDENLCGIEFNGTLSDYDENCSYVPCVENWTCSGYGACVNLTQNCTDVIDENSCGTNYTGNYSEFPPQACGGTFPSPSAIGLEILILDLLLFIIISVADGMMARKTPETNRAFRALYGLIGLIAIVAVLAMLL